MSRDLGYNKSTPKQWSTPEPAMTEITIPAQVVNGHLHHEKNLAELEGQHVLATLTVVPADAANGNGKLAPAKPDESAEFDPEPPQWLEIENDVYFSITAPERLLEKRPLIIERGTPSRIVPEDLPDE
jgi:hypothetical protein